mmetsp:Transcript_3614/g.5605  ORF Transcript_3614/g.5605 Transcript_3614/m.5605 type:complete len:474 (-) Transcript_3614:526-1947(-)
MKPHPSTTDRVAQLLANTPTKTVLVPISKLKRPDISKRVNPKSITLPKDALSSSRSALSLGSSIGEEYSVCGSMGSEYSYSSMGESLRNRIRIMEEKIKEAKECGALEEFGSLVPLPAELCSWNKRISKRYRDRARPPVNIIGCHQPADLIVARADERIRKQLQAKELKEKHMEEVVKYIDHLIHMKLTRGERYAAMLQEQQRQMSWMRLVVIMKYVSVVMPMIKSVHTEHRRLSTQDKAAAKLQTNLTSWYERRILRRYVSFVNQITDVMWRFRLQMSIIQKRCACRVIRTHLTEKREQREFSGLVHAFLTGVRKIQALARGFIACKLNRIRSLALIWDDIETQYLQVMLAQRKQEMSNQSSRSMKHLVIDEKLRIEIDRQNSKWEHTDKKFSKILDNYRKNGELDAAVESSTIESLKVPEKVKIHFCCELIRQKRREHTQRMMEMQRRLTHSLQVQCRSLLCSTNPLRSIL